MTSDTYNSYLKKNKILILLYGLTIPLLISCSNKKTSKLKINDVFSFSIPYAPQTFDPILQQGINSKHLLNHLYLTLLKWSKNGELEPYGAQSCDWKNNELVCILKKNMFFQDGTPIHSEHYLKSINLLKQENIKDTIDFENVVIKTEGNYRLIFKTKKNDYSLKNKLTFLEISPRKEKRFYKSAESVVSSTNYRIYEYKKNQSITLYKEIKELEKNKKIIGVKIYFIEDQSTALRLFESKQLNLLTQLPTRELELYIDSNKLFYTPMVRMDGIFFKNNFDTFLKKSLFHSLNFLELKSLYRSEGMPGCPTLPKIFFLNQQCYNFDLALAKKYLNKAQNIPPRIKLTYSTLGGDDIQKGMEWMSNQWKKNLNLEVELEPTESGVFFQKIRDKNFDIIRKGVPLSTPTCLEAIEIFYSNSHNNLSIYKNNQLDNAINALRNTDPKYKSKIQKYCDQGLKILYKDYAFLPLGPIYFSYLDDQKYKGWFINMLNIIDLENLDLNNVKKEE